MSLAKILHLYLLFLIIFVHRRWQNSQWVNYINNICCYLNSKLFYNNLSLRPDLLLVPSRELKAYNCNSYLKVVFYVYQSAHDCKPRYYLVSKCHLTEPNLWPDVHTCIQYLRYIGQCISWDNNTGNNLSWHHHR